MSGHVGCAPSAELHRQPRWRPDGRLFPPTSHPAIPTEAVAIDSTTTWTPTGGPIPAAITTARTNALWK
jgi:hypothetical protein